MSTEIPVVDKKRPLDDNPNGTPSKKQKLDVNEEKGKSPAKGNSGQSPTKENPGQSPAQEKGKSPEKGTPGKTQDAPIEISELKDLSLFRVTERLNEKAGEFANYVGVFKGSNGKAIIKLRRSMPCGKDLEKRLSDTTLNLRGMNKAWGSFQGTFPGPSVNLDIFYPRILKVKADEEAKLIGKLAGRLRPRPIIFVAETAEDYQAHTKPYIDSIPESDIGWVSNIVQNVAKEKKECYEIKKGRTKEKVVWSDPDPENGFALLVDFKWKKHPKKMSVVKNVNVNADNLYCVAFPMRSDIKTLRDLRGSHLPLLRHIRAEGTARIKKLYGLKRHQLRVFIHYMPQFYYFHVHFTSISIDYGVHAGHARLLDEVIGNLGADPLHYTKCLLSYTLVESHKLAKKLCSNLATPKKDKTASPKNKGTPDKGEAVSEEAESKAETETSIA